MLAGPNTALLFSLLGERYGGLYVNHRTNLFSDSQPQMPVLSALMFLMKLCCLNSYRLPMQMLASLYFSPFLTYNTFST